MKTFLEDLAETIYRKYGDDTGSVSVIFPNKRAGLFFTRALSDLITKPIWSPRIYSIEEFLCRLAGLDPEERIPLMLELYKSYKKITGFEESFDRFFYWGELLLNDFNDIDRYLTDAGQVFKTLKDLKEIDAAFPFLTEEQKRIIAEFWGNISDPRSEYREGFLRFWRTLPEIYNDFRRRLIDNKIAYPGMIYKEVCRKIQNGKFAWEGGNLVFAGFNALSITEEIIIKWFLENRHGEIFWDTDSYYLYPPWHEAGVFQRKYLKDPVLGKTFAPKIPGYIKNHELKIEIISTSSNISQAQWAGSKIRELLRQNNISPEKTAVVLPDESMILPVLTALPSEAGKVNITMAYPVTNSPLFSFFELVIELHENRKVSSGVTWFSHRQVLPLLSHPVLKSPAGETALNLASDIRERNRIYIPSDFLSAGGILNEIFRDVKEDENVPEYLSGLIPADGHPVDNDAYHREIRFYFYRLFRRIRKIFDGGDIPVTFTLLKRIFRQVARLERISFTGEPLEGMQVMGILETRNLDFENVILLNVNEGIFPRPASHNSFIPYQVRKAFGMPNFEHTGSIYAYLFYRLLQRSERLFLLYNSEETGQSPGEPSRFIQQLKYESGLTLQESILTQPIRINRSSPLVIEKNDRVMELLSTYLEGGSGESKFLTPSALNTYLDCPVSFYFKHLLGIREKEEVTSDLNALILGNILHEVMDELYRPLIGKGGVQVGKEYIKGLPGQVDTFVDRVFASHFGGRKNEKFEFAGRNILGREIILKLVQRILEIDHDYAPFNILGTEMKILYSIPVTRVGNPSRVGDPSRVKIRGIIDRIDEKDGKLRIIDYKSGKDKRHFSSVEDLFSPDERKRNKAAFQTLFYSMVISGENASDLIPVPGLYNIKELYQEYFSPELRTGKTSESAPITSLQIPGILEVYREKLELLIEEIFDKNIPFRHADESIPCKFCERAGFPT